MKLSAIEDSVIMVGEYGSVAQGTATPDSDHDYMAVYIESPEQVIGLEDTETKRVSDAAEGEKSAPGTSDTTYHSLRKFVQLAAGGNPTIGSILFLPEYQVESPEWDALLDIRHEFVTKKAGRAYLGYMDAQIKAFSETGRKNRAELVEQYGYDIKFGYHAFRLGTQGFFMLAEGQPQVPLIGESLRYARAIRAGQIEKAELLEVLAGLRNDLVFALDSSTLPDTPDMVVVNSYLTSTHRHYWRKHNL